MCACIVTKAYLYRGMNENFERAHSKQLQSGSFHVTKRAQHKNVNKKFYGDQQ